MNIARPFHEEKPHENTLAVEFDLTVSVQCRPSSGASRCALLCPGLDGQMRDALMLLRFHYMFILLIADQCSV